MIKIHRSNVIRLLCEIREMIYKNLDLKVYFGDVYLSNKIEQTDLEVFCYGVSNGFLSELVHAILGCEVEIIGDAEKLLPCPCCGYKTLTEQYDVDEGTGYDICPYCNWEDDGTIDNNIISSVNNGSILDYRKRLQLNPNKYYIDKWFK